MDKEPPKSSQASEGSDEANLADVIPLIPSREARIRLLAESEAVGRHPARGNETVEQTLARLGIELTDDDDVE